MNQQYHFRWKPTSHGIKYEDLNKNPARKLAVNHAEGHSELTDKSRLYINLSSYCKINKINIDIFIPKTFILNIEDDTFENGLIQFLEFFEIQNQIENV